MLEQALKHYFGHSHFRTGQKEVIQIGSESSGYISNHAHW